MSFMKTLNCEKCNSPYRVSEYRVTKAKYCSRLCANRSQTYKNNSVMLTCLACRTPFLVAPYRSKKALFCSRKCAYSNYPVQLKLGKIIVCSICKNTFYRPPWYLQKYGEKFCSSVCYGKKLTINPDIKLLRTSYKYLNWRKKIMRLGKNVCSACGSVKSLQADHIKPVATHPHLVYEVDNGKILCITCHKKTPTYGWKMIHNRILV